jgi:hypothetical protein
MMGRVAEGMHCQSDRNFSLCCLYIAPCPDVLSPSRSSRNLPDTAATLLPHRPKCRNVAPRRSCRPNPMEPCIAEAEASEPEAE